MRSLGCLFVLLLLAVVAAEVWLIIYLGGIAEDIGGHLTVILVAVVLSIIGFRLAKWRGSRLPEAMMRGRIGRAAAGMAGAVLIAFPGFATAAVGLLLQLPPVQALCAGFMQKLFLVLTASAMKRMGKGGGFPGGGFSGGGAGFPGAGAQGGAGPAGGISPQQMQQAMAAMQAMQQGGKGPGGRPGRTNLGGGKKPPKTYDVKPER